jgi:hypothetical protein
VGAAFSRDEEARFQIKYHKTVSSGKKIKSS